MTSREGEDCFTAGLRGGCGIESCTVHGDFTFGLESEGGDGRFASMMRGDVALVIVDVMVDKGGGGGGTNMNGIGGAPGGVEGT